MAHMLMLYVPTLCGAVPVASPPLRMVALDMDGTLLNANHELSADSLSTLRSLSSRGITIALCSGRSTAAIHDHAEKLALSKPMPVVAFNGAAGFLAAAPGYCLAAKELFCVPLPDAAVDVVLSAAERQGELVQYYVERDIEVVCKTDAHVELTRRYATLTGVAAHKYAESYAEGRARGLPYKCLVMTDDADATLAYMRDSMPEGLATLIRGTPPFFVEVLHPDVNKGNGLVQMCKALGIPIEQVVAFGDGDNDIEFVSKAGLGIAMRNARPTLLEVADRVTERTNDEDGVAHALHQLEAEGLLSLPAPRKVRGQPAVTIRRVNPRAVVGVRERVMWPGQPEMCILEEDDLPNALHLAVMNEANGAAAAAGDAGVRATDGAARNLPSSTVCGVLSLFLPADAAAAATGGGGSGSDAGDQGRDGSGGGPVARFRKLAVEPEWRRRGLATALIETAAAEARLAGAETLACDARASQADFYAARGFQRASEPFDKYPGKGGELYVKMEMTL